MKIVFVTFYDPGSRSVGLLGAIAESMGAEVMHVNLRRHRKKNVTYGREDSQNYHNLHGGIQVAVNQSVSPISDEDMAFAGHYINGLYPDYVAISLRSSLMDYGERLAQYINVPILCGGWGPIMEPGKAGRWADYVCQGDGEPVIQDLLVKGDIEALQKTYPPVTAEELSAFPPPHISGPKINIEGKEVTQITTYNTSKVSASRGCPMRCAYCCAWEYQSLYRQHGYKSPKTRTRTVDSVIEECKYLVSLGTPSISFMDDIFPWNVEWLNEFIEKWRTEMHCLPFWIYVRPELHSMGMISRLKEVGFGGKICIGFQSVSNRVLDVYNRPISAEKNLKFMDDLKREVGWTEFTYDIISHCPYEVEDELKEKLKFFWKLPFNKLSVFPLTVFPNSELAKKIERDQPVGANDVLQDWYAWLLSISCITPGKRRLSKTVYYLRLFKQHPRVLWTMAYWFNQTKKKIRGGRKA